MIHPLLVPLAFLAFISLGLPDGLVGPAWPSISTGFGVPIDALGVVVGAYTGGYLVSSFMGGALMRRMAMGTLLALATALAAAGLFGFAAAPSFAALVVAAAAAGASGGAIDAALNAFGAKYFSPRILNWLHGFYGIGATLGPLIVTAVLSADLGWQTSFFVVGAAQSVLALAFVLTRRAWDRPGGEGQVDEATVAAAATLVTLARPRVWLGMAVFALYAGIEISVAHWSFSVLTLGRGVPEVTAGFYVALYWGSLTAGRLGFGIIANAVDLVWALAVAIVLAATGAFLFWLDPFLAAAPIGMAVMGFALAPIFASLISLTPHRVGAAHADTAIGFQIAAAAVGGAVFTAAIGVAADAMGLRVIGGVIFAMTLLLLVAYAAFVRTGVRPAKSRSAQVDPT